MTHAIPVITIDGPTASGKGTVAQRVATALGWRVLDSGALYRLTALAVLQKGIDPSDANTVAHVARDLQVQFHPDGVLLDGQEVSSLIRQEQVAIAMGGWSLTDKGRRALHGDAA